MDKYFSENLIHMAEEVKTAGHTLYVVGGATRNILMGLPINDIDICSDMPLLKFMDICKANKYAMSQVSEKYGSVKVNVSDTERYEFTSFRVDTYDSTGSHMPIEVEHTDSIDIDSDRRDFDINCIYYDILADTYYDKHNGKNAIKNKTVSTLSTTTPVLSCDGQRILRLIRISNELGFKIAKSTDKDAMKYAYKVKDIPSERRLQELKDIVVSDCRYGINTTPNFLELLNRYGLYEYLVNTTTKNVKLNLKKDSVKHYYTLQKESRFVGFAILLMEATLGYRHHNENLILYVTNTLFGMDGLKCSGEDLRTINKVYVLYQNLQYSKSKEVDLLMATSYAMLSTGEKDILSHIVSKDRYVLLTKALDYLKENNLPTSLNHLDITPTNLIDAGIKKELVSKMMDVLFKGCLTLEVENKYEELLDYAKDLNKQMQAMVKEINEKTKEARLNMYAKAKKTVKNKNNITKPSSKKTLYKKKSDK